MVGFTDKKTFDYAYFPDRYHFDGVVVTNTASRRNVWKHCRIYSRVTDGSSHTQSYSTVLSLVRIYSPNVAGPVCNR